MIEQVYKISTGNDKAVEKVIYDENLHYLHMVFNKGEGLPEHFSNSNVSFKLYFFYFSRLIFKFASFRALKIAC